MQNGANGIRIRHRRTSPPGFARQKCDGLALSAEGGPRPFFQQTIQVFSACSTFEKLLTLSRRDIIGMLLSMQHNELFDYPATLRSSGAMF